MDVLSPSNLYNALLLANARKKRPARDWKMNVQDHGKMYDLPHGFRDTGGGGGPAYPERGYGFLTYGDGTYGN